MEEIKALEHGKKALAVPGQKTETIQKMGLLFIMYILQKIFLCFTWTLLPIILRSQGASLGTIGLTTIIYTPWAMKFLYASIVDKFYHPGMGRRKSWIVPLLFISLILLPILSMLSPEKNLTLLLAAVFLLNIVSATMDIAVDGYATDILHPRERPWGNTIQSIGYMMGYMLGGGFFLMIYHHQGWQSTLLLIAILHLVLMIPVVLHKEIPPVSLENKDPVSENQGKAMLSPSAWAFIQKPKSLWFLFFLMLMAILDQGGVHLRLPMLVDLGYTPSTLGYLNLWCGTFFSVSGSIFGAILYRRIGLGNVFYIGCLLVAALNFYSAFIAQTPLPSLWQVGILIGAEKFILGVITIMIFSMIMGFSAGDQSATDNAVLNSLVHIVVLGIAPVLGQLCDMAGFTRLYAGLGAASILILFAGNYILRRHLPADQFQ